MEYLDTGAMYRSVTFAALRRGLDPSDQEAVGALSEQIEIEVDREQVLVDGVDATIEIRGREVTSAVSAVAANSRVRVELVRRQRAWVAEHGGGVVEGRDIASVVFPDATLKLYVTASARVRAERRVAEIGGDVDEVETSIIGRDRQDSTRVESWRSRPMIDVSTRVDSPLIEASGAVAVDTSDLSIDEVVAQVMELIPS